MSDDDKLIKISEIFGPTIQGEGLLIGEPCIFVRTAGCDFRCNWCDSLHAVDSKFRHYWHLMSSKQIFTEIERLSGKEPLTVTISGGNPAIQDMSALIELGLSKNYRFALETQGSIYQKWFDLLYNLVLSPKPPSSGMINNWSAFNQCCQSKAQNIIIKIPVLDEADYLFAKNISELYPRLQMFLQPVNNTPPSSADIEQQNHNSFIDINDIYQRLEWLIERALKDKWYNVKILPQLHVLIWGNKPGV